METKTISVDQLRAALLRWEIDARRGPSLTRAEMEVMPPEQVAEQSTTLLWNLLGE